jgi:KaiC/GvpD/RAD55 family RecA-like ATPase
VVGLKTKKKLLLLVLSLFYILPSIISAKISMPVKPFVDLTQTKDYSNDKLFQDNQMVGSQGSTYKSSSSAYFHDTDQAVTESSGRGLTVGFNGGVEMLQSSSSLALPSFSRHLMCKDHTPYYEPIEPTTIFSPSDSKAVCLTTVSVNDRIEFKWYYRDNMSKTWVSCYNWSAGIQISGENYFAGYLTIAGYWPGIYYPKAYKVDVFLDGSYSFSEYFEVTNGGLNSPRMCQDINENREPVGITSRFTIGVEARAYHYFELSNIAYFNEELGCCHNFTTVWTQPGGSVYKTHLGSFSDYKDVNLTWNYWKSGVSVQDYISINSSTPVGNWKVEVYLDRYYFNGTWVGYGPLATTRFVVSNESVADWTFMVYLDADNSLESAGIDVFLEMASVGSTPQVNIVAQFDRIPDLDSRYGDWTDCKRFYLTKGMTPTPGNATEDLGELDMGNATTLRDFVNWTISSYPAKHYCLVLWDHGIGCMGLCFDVTNNDSLTLPKLSQALDGLPAIMDVTFLDACSTGMIEVAYQLMNYANILISQEGLGYQPAPYNLFLSALTSNSSMTPDAFAGKLVTDYIGWCKSIPDIQNATVSAVDLTKIGNLRPAVTDFAQKLLDKETPYLTTLLSSHEQIILARNLTQAFQGPYAGQFENYIDLYNFAQLNSQYNPDEEIRNAADQLMLTLQNIVFIEDNKNLPDSHGLSIFFPDTQDKYQSFAAIYENTDFAKYSPWSEFVKYYLSGHILTVKIPQAKGIARIENKTFTADEYGMIQTFVKPGNYTVDVTALVSIDSGSREVFLQWSDNYTSNPRTVSVNSAMKVEAIYETQYRLAIHGNCGVATPPYGEHWYRAGSMLEINATAPSITPGERYVFIKWNGLGNGSYNSSDNPAYITIRGPLNETAVWRHDFFLTVTSLYGSPAPTTGWFEAGKNITASVNSTVSGSSGTRYVCIGWTGNGSALATGTTASETFSINETSSIVWNWKTQYLLTVRTEPNELISPIVTPSGPWYDEGSVVNCTAQQVGGYEFDQWIVNGVKWNNKTNSLLLTMNRPIEVTLHYALVPAWWEPLLNPTMTLIYLAIAGVGLVGILTRSTRVRTNIKRLIARAPAIETTNVLPNRTATGYKDLDNLLYGGIPENYAVVLASPSCDERDWLIRRFLETGAKNSEYAFYVTLNAGEARALAEHFPSNFYLFVCNPQADKIIENLPNVYRLKGIESLTEISIALIKAFRCLKNPATTPKRACLEIVSDVLLQHQAIQTRKWLTDIITEFKTEGFTTLAIINPTMHPPEEVNAITDLFEGEIRITERTREKKFLKIQKMYNKKYLECEIPMRKPETQEV